MRSSSADRRGLLPEEEGSEVALVSRETPGALEVECLVRSRQARHMVHMRANLEERSVGGYSVAYRRDDTNFPVYVTAALAAMFFTAAWITDAAYWLTPPLPGAPLPYFKTSLFGNRRPAIRAQLEFQFFHALL